MIVQEEHVARPDWEHYSDVPLFNPKAVAQQTGVPAPTLRVWERRYQLLSPQRGENSYRLYSERDIGMVRWLKERVDQGMSIRQAIALLHHVSQDLEEERPTEEHGSESSVTLSTPLPATQEPISPAERYHAVARPPDDIKQSEGDDSGLYNMQMVQARLLEAFEVVDEAAASRLMTSMLAIYPVEEICTDLIAPTLWRVGCMWEEGHTTVAVEHFASAFFRGMLTNLFHLARTPNTGPLVMVCCAPGETHEVAPLMIALNLRRTGMRVVYLGQSIETAGLLQTFQHVRPVLICVSLTIPEHLTALIDLARHVQKLPAPRPALAFGGQAFAHDTQLIAQVPGIYLHGDLQTTVARLRDLAYQHK